MPNELCEVAEVTEPVPSINASEGTRSSLLHHYEAIAKASCAMLAAARADDWIEVGRQEERCCALIETLKAAADFSNSLLDEADDARRMQLLRRILADDAQIRAHAEPWLEPIAPYISTPRASETNEAK